MKTAPDFTTLFFLNIEDICQLPKHLKNGFKLNSVDRRIK